MKKQLLTIFSAIAVSASFAQVVSPSWQTLQNTSYTMAASASCKFLDVVSSNVVWGVGYGGTGVSANFNDFTRTTNGGVTFTGGNIYADTNTYVIANIEGIDANTAWVCAYTKSVQAMGAIHKTTNGGTTWINMTAPGMFTNTTQSFADFVAFLTPSVGIALGDPVGGEFEIWRTADAGATWTIVPGANIPNPTTGEYGLVNIYTKQGTTNLWYGTNKGRIFRSTDAGLTWSVAVLPGTPTASLNVNDIAFTNSLTGVAYVYNSSTTPSTFEEYVTSNGGASWTQVTVSPILGKNDICAVPGTNIFVSCANTSTANPSNLSYSKDGGLTWVDFGSSNIAYLSVDFADAFSGWAATFQSAPATGGIYKYNGPTSIFTVAPTVCLSGPSATVVPANWSLGNPTGSYTWSASSPNVAFSSPTATNPVITFTTNGTYTISLLSSNAFTTNSVSQVVNVIGCVSPAAVFSVPSGTLCNKAVVNFTNSSTGNPTPTYSWSTSPATNVTISPSSTATNAAITFSNPGTYSVTLIATNINGSVATTQTVNISNCAPNASFLLPANNCTFAAMTVTNSSSTSGGAMSYTWSVNASSGVTVSPNSVAASPTISFSNAGTYTITLLASNSSGNATSSQTVAVAASCVGIHENSLLSENVKLYPNPTKDMVNVSLPHNGSEFSITVTDILGSVIYSQKNSKNSDVQINLANKSKGVYFITIEGNKEKATKKIIVE